MNTVAIAAVVLTLGVSTAPARAETRFALLVGHNIGDANETPLHWAESDAARFRQVLTQIGNVHPDRALLVQRPATRDFDRAYARIQGAIAEAERRGEATVLLFYFSGHADEAALHLATERLAIEKLEADLASVGADTVLAIIDACRNDRTPRAAAKGATRVPGFEWPAPGPSIPKGYVRLNSAAQGEVAQESDTLQASLFSHHLLSGMRGSADFDRDGVVTLGELYRYGYRKTLEGSHREAGAVQHSELEVALSGRGELIVTYPRRAQAQLVFDEQLEGHLLIVDDASGRIVGELEQKKGVAQRLAVASGRYRLQVRHGGQFRTGLINAGRGERRVTAAELTPQGALAVLQKGAQFDPHPFVLAVGAGAGRSLVEGFGIVPLTELGLAWRWTPRWRLALQGFAGYGQADSTVWQLQQLEWGASLGVDWAPVLTQRWEVWFGLRGGAVGAVQSGDRTDADRLVAGRVDDAQLELSEAAVGPDAAAHLTVEYHPFARFGFRLSIVPSVRWLAVDDSTAARFGLSGQLSGVFRL